MFLPPYSPDFSPIEIAFFKLQALLRNAAARTVDELWSVVLTAPQHSQRRNTATIRARRI